MSNFIGGAGFNEDEEDIAINPTNPDNLFLYSNASLNGGPVGTTGGMMASTSMDGGATWNSRFIATGSDQFEAACCDPSAAFDSFGNLFVSYLSQTAANTVLLTSTDGGQNFTTLATFGDTFDQPKLAAGSNSVWIDWTSNTDGNLEGVGASTSGLGQVGTFTAVQTVPGTFTGSRNFGKIAVGPNGTAMATFQNANSGIGPDTIFVTTNGGIGSPAWSTPVAVSSTNVGGFAPAPPQPNRTVDSEAGPAWDRSGGSFNGRAYIVYTDRPSTSSTQFDIFLRTSADNGNTWSAPVRVTDDSTGRPKILPRIKVDHTNGDLAISWLDTRNDSGQGQPNDFDGIAGDEPQEYLTFSFDGGVTFEPNIQVTTSASSAIVNPNVPGAENEFGDYTGLDFFNGIAYPAWPDNSLTLPGNLDAPNSFDVATAAVFAIGNPPDDRFEPNETTSSATRFGRLTGSQSVLNLTLNRHRNGLFDYDNYRWSMGRTGTLTVTETDDGSRGGIELHLFKLVRGRLVNVGELTGRLPLIKTLSVSVRQGDVIIVQVKGRNYARGRLGIGNYHLDVSLV